MAERLCDNVGSSDSTKLSSKVGVPMSTLQASIKNDIASQKTAKPFLKWAGGKGQLLGQIGRRFPAELQEGRITKYAEPFIGGGAVLFLTADRFSIDKVYVSDRNADLILAYRTIKEQVEGLITRLEEIERRFLGLTPKDRKSFFYEVRRLFNKRRQFSSGKALSRHAELHVARLIFLNRTCFNGLYRVNSRGEFNVPFGNYRNPMICNSSNLRSVSRLLENAFISCGDFSDCKHFVDDRTFVYFDPPYRPISRTANFNSYAPSRFDDGEQERLALFFQELDESGAKLMLSNSDPQNEDPNDTFFLDLYSKFHIHKVSASRRINSNGAKRGEVTELLITNYEVGGFSGR